MKELSHKVLTMVVCLSFVSVAFAQRYQSDYQIKGDRVLYNGRPIVADARSFQILGYGYAKDRMNVYLDGVVLRFVDPSTFRLQMGGRDLRGHGAGNVHRGRGVPENNRLFAPEYVVSRYDVIFDGRKVQGASVNTFKDLRDGYAKDAFNAYYFGEKLQGVTSSSFQNIGAGYAKDAFDVFFCGEKIRGASSNTFKILDEGYAKDAFNVYFCGKKIQGASAITFVYDGNGYAHDSFKRYYLGEVYR